MKQETIISKDGKTKVLKTTQLDGSISYSFITEDNTSEAMKEYHRGVQAWLDDLKR